MYTRMLVVFCVVVLFGCKGQVEKEHPAEGQEDVVQEVKRPSALEKGKFITMDGKPFLFGGEDSTDHFDIGNLALKKEQFHYGIGRETFDALIEPEFISEAAADSIYADSSRVLLLTLGKESKVYGIDLLTHHEVVNDVVDGKYVAAAYCILADLGAVYSREMGGTHLTFALSGYTYYDPEVWDGMDGFVWWDRETESLWWPLVGKAVSGPLRDVPLNVLDEAHWSQTTWGAVKDKYRDLQVLKPGQKMEAPDHWPKLDRDEMGKFQRIGQAKNDVAPRWGEN